MQLPRDGNDSIPSFKFSTLEKTLVKDKRSTEASRANVGSRSPTDIQWSVVSGQWSECV